MQPQLEPLSPHISVFVSETHRFNTDTILLAHFAAPKRGSWPLSRPPSGAKNAPISAQAAAQFRFCGLPGMLPPVFAG